MNTKIKTIFIALYLLLPLLTAAQEEKITNDQIYHELKVFQARTEERFKAID